MRRVKTYQRAKSDQLELEAVQLIYKKSQEILETNSVTECGLNLFAEKYDKENLFVRLKSGPIDLRQSAAEINKLAISVIERWYVSEQYTKKRNDYNRLFLRIKKDLKALEREDPSSTLIEQLQWKRNRLKELIEIADSLAHDYDKSTEERFLSLEAKVLFYLAPTDFSVIMSSGVLHQSGGLFGFYVKKLRLQIISLVRKMQTNRKRNGRQVLRDIVQFLFKNMDDEADADQFFNRIRKKLIISKIYHPWIINKQYKLLGIY